MILFLHKTICKLTNEKIKVILYYALTFKYKKIQSAFFMHKFSAKLNFQIFIKAADYNYFSKLPEINTSKFIFVTDS